MRSSENDLLFIYLTIDLVILNLAILFTGWVSFYLFDRSSLEMSIYLLHGNLSWVLTYFIFAKRNLYLRDGYLNRVWRISKRILVFLVVSSVLAFIAMPKSYSRTFFLEYTLLFYVGKLIFYRFLYSFMKYKRKKGLNTVRVAIVGMNDTSQFLRQLIESNPMLGYKFVGFVSSKEGEGLEVLGKKEDLENIIREQAIQLVFVSLSIFSEENRGKEYLKICNRLGIRLRFVPENQQWFKSRINMESLGGLMILNPQRIPLDDVSSRVWKRLFDIAFSSLVILLLFSWLFPILIILIKLESKGPAFFVQKRTGINNRTFNCIKFRSMKVNGQSDERQATQNDDRITPLGKFMRKTNIDELPQFFNVLWGQMSVVGPRPHMLKHTEQYSTLIDHYLSRHYVKPGITGWAQIRGYRGNTDELWKMEKRVKYDMEYIENWTFVWDLKIIWFTVFGSNAYKNAG
jgi:Undecaprenyl-phosphate glucose phosphotransferase